MATSVETLKMIISAEDTASNVLGKIETSTDKLGAAGRSLNSIMGMLAGQIGLLGPVGNVAGNALLGLASGLSKITIAGGLATIGVGALFSAWKHFTEEREQFRKAIESGDLKFFAAEVERLNNRVGDRRPFDLAIGNWQDLGKSAIAVLFNLDEKLAAYRGQLERLTSERINEITRGFELQARTLEGGAAEKVVLNLRKALDDLSAQFRAGKIIFQEFQAARAGLQLLEETQLKLLNQETTAIGKNTESLEIMNQARLQERLLIAQRAGDTKLVQAIEMEIGASKRRLSVLDQELRAEQAVAAARKAALGAVDPGGALAKLQSQINQIVESGLPATPEMLANMARSVDEAQRKALQTFGIEVPAHVQVSIDKANSLIQKFAELSGIDFNKIKEEAKGALNAAGGLTDQGSLKNIELIEGVWINVVKEADSLKGESAAIKKEIDGIIGKKTAMDGLFGGAIANTQTFNSLLRTTVDLMNRISNAPPRPTAKDTLEENLKIDKLTTNQPEY